MSSQKVIWIRTDFNLILSTGQKFKPLTYADQIRQSRRVGHNRNCILLPNLSFYRIILPNKKISKTLRIVTTTRLKEKTQKSEKIEKNVHEI